MTTMKSELDLDLARADALITRMIQDNNEITPVEIVAEAMRRERKRSEDVYFSMLRWIEDTKKLLENIK